MAEWEYDDDDDGGGGSFGGGDDNDDDDDDYDDAVFPEGLRSTILLLDQARGLRYCCTAGVKVGLEAVSTNRNRFNIPHVVQGGGLGWEA